MLPHLPKAAPRQAWLWLAPYVAIGIFALAMLVLTGLLQWRELDTARSALEGDMHWAERTIENRLHAHQDFLGELGREQEFKQLTYESFQVKAARYVRDAPEIQAIIWIDTDGKVEWVAPNESTATFVGEQLSGVRLAALQEALRVRRTVVSPDYRNETQRPAHDIILPVQRGSADIGAFIALQSLETLLRATLPTVFTTRYSLTVVDAENRELFTNSSVKPTERQLSGTISLDLPNNRLGLNIVAYRLGGAWLPFVPAALITILTLIATITLIQLRRHAKHRAATEEELRAAYAFRQAMSQSLITGLRAIDLDGRITFVNSAFCRMTGFDENELIGIKPPYPYWPAEEFDRLKHNIDTALAGKAPASGFEMRIMRKSGERFDVRLYFSPLIDTHGLQIGWMASMNDITEPKRVRVELERAHERFVTVIDGLDSAVHVADVQTGEILFANRAFQNIFGFDTVGRNSALVTAPCHPNPEWLSRDPLQIGPEELPCELFDGEIQHTLSGHWYHLHERAIRWVDGRTVRVQIAADITDKKHIEEVNLQQQKRLEQTSRLITMGEMASSLAHELNQPLSAIANYCAGCVKRMQAGNYRLDDLLAAMQKASSQAERAGKIIRRMRDMVKKGDPNRQPIALEELVDETRAFADIEAQRTGTQIIVDLPDNLPRIVVDRIMIEQVLLNLVKNGIEAMIDVPFERRQLTLQAKVVDDRMLEIAVTDQGHGLDEADIEKIFAPFYTTKPEGMGIGLAICRSIIEFHQGRLWVEPRREGGTVFHFTVPIEETVEVTHD
ncbi:PAS domain-containing sensor histidine kinase [Ferribacterium limneticum]|uniref:PAS domain-containing sensor histidine kinase n=1 Tax=Ferribacterium limneticum TaxID=76259 RepID=UPI001CFBBA3B|nr:PAS domain S-box protein [Ferribacterium limneticum]UCV29554.1 PAS domain S-box protein [Ferribacterium limneticum]UCV33473.1 PAS domain S-box protein [Ferribacterium limneticum]